MKKILLASALIAASSIACAEISVKDAWVRATVPQQQSTGAFMQINSSSAVRLVAARSSAAKVVEIHEMKMEDNVMKMREIAGVDIAAGSSVELKPGGYHVMLINLNQQIRDGDVVPVSLVFEDKNKKRETVEIKVPARPLNATQVPTSAPASMPAHAH